MKKSVLLGQFRASAFNRVEDLLLSTVLLLILQATFAWATSQLNVALPQSHALLHIPFLSLDEHLSSLNNSWNA